MTKRERILERALELAITEYILQCVPRLPKGTNLQKLGKNTFAWFIRKATKEAK